MYVVCENCKAEFEARYSPARVQECAYCMKKRQPSCCRRETPPRDKVASKITKRKEL